MFLGSSLLGWATLLVEFSRNPDATVEITGLAPPKADSHNPSSNPRGQDRCSVSFFPRSWAPGDAVLSRCEHRERHTGGRIYPLRKVRTLGALGRYSSDWSKLLHIIFSQTGLCNLTAGKSVLFTTDWVGYAAGMDVALRNAELSTIWARRNSLSWSWWQI